MKYPALEVSGIEAERLQVIVDDFSPSALEEQPHAVTIFFPDAERREGARLAIAAAAPTASAMARDVDDEDWARRLQENLTPVTVGGITIVPPWHEAPPRALVIAPSMGFGTGHHATTRLCLSALQAIDLRGKLMVDVGTGSGILALAARLLGAREAIGFDSDADAVHAANENLTRNPALTGVRFFVADLRAVSWPAAQVVTANLTGALLAQTAPRLMAAVAKGGLVIVSGILCHERDTVVGAFSPAGIAWEAEEDEWLGLAFNRDAAATV